MLNKKGVSGISSYPNKEKGLILTITIIFVLILVIMAGVVLVLMTNHTRVTETQIRRVRGVDAAESAALVRAYDELRLGLITPPYYNGAYLNNFNGMDVSLCVVPKSSTYPCGSISFTCPATAPSPYCVRAKVTYSQ